MNTPTIALFNYDSTGTGFHKTTHVMALESNDPTTAKINQMIVEKHVANGGVVSRDVKIVSKKKVVGANGMKVTLISIDGVEHEMYADWSCVKR